ncbi:hypothetical protein FA95DRAFT_1556334 [Auriscalpium vulgare]|uniref:Uncharacterized protein n=1 Tax=Auriscalpium vulgare TaxID=40419 RepID=A0ACB8S134_9AGAM|nr:hypothetical protein FA95DRAFT_1556334 [Auriscalpium vulgare]
MEAGAPRSVGILQSTGRRLDSHGFLILIGTGLRSRWRPSFTPDQADGPLLIMRCISNNRVALYDARRNLRSPMQPSRQFYSLLELYIYGIYTCLFGFALHILVRRLRGSTTNKCLTIVITVMYLIGTAHAIGRAWPFIPASYRDESARTAATNELLTSIATLNFVLGDGIVMWRAYIIWERNRRILVVSCLLLLIMLGASLWQIIYTIFRVQSNIDHAYEDGLFMTLPINVVTTGLTGYRAWRHYRSSSVVKIRIGRDRVLTILLLLVESGALYCAIWVAVISVCVRPASTVSVSSIGSEIVAAALPHIGGMYPTAIIVLCKLQAAYSNTIMDLRDDSPLPAFAANASLVSGPSSNNQDPVRVQFATLPGNGGRELHARHTSLHSVFSADIRTDKEQIV